ncbi:hypothetical protein [Dyadobacter diqingensis]|uniref:hypothetical protein n=1 Tax=Dyadobacter diqingensis TaxID=2938121 RepID=UPI0020C1AB71|nr:hypothetical protein [Dyadobacter diqingensis]
MNDYFSQYKELKKILKFRENDIEFEFPMAIEVMSVAHKEKINLFKIIVSFFFVYNFPKAIKNIKNQRILFSDAYERKEYSRLLQIIRQNVGDNSHIHFRNIDLIPHFNLKIIISSIGFSFKVLSGKVSLKNTFYIASRLTFYRNCLSVLQHVDNTTPFQLKKYIAFNGQYGIEALLAQFFKQKGVETYTLTHGKSYVNYKKTIPQDIINGENISVDKVLVWGNSGKKELIENFGIPEKNVIVAGNLNYPSKKINVKQTFKNGIILLGRKIYDEGNKDILRIAEEVALSQGIKFSVRLHPSLSYEIYSNLCKSSLLSLTNNEVSLQEMFLAGQYDFAIVNNSTTYYESMYHNMVCLRYEPDENEQYEGLDDKFGDSKTFYERISFFQKIDNKLLNEKINKLLSDNLGMGINRYKEILGK